MEKSKVKLMKLRYNFSQKILSFFLVPVLRLYAGDIGKIIIFFLLS